MAAPAAIPPRAGLHGHLRLVCGTDATGRSYLREQSAAVPVHLSKPFWDGGVLVLNVINPTAGLLAGDEIRTSVRVETGAKLSLTTASATRIHDTQTGEARVEQSFTIASGAWLELWPEIVIPQGGARYRQTTRVEVEKGGELLLMESLAPGRLASGEAFAFARLEWETKLFYEGRKIVRERYAICRENGSLHVLQTVFPHAYQASLFIVSERLSEGSPCWQVLQDLHGPDVWLGSSRLSQAGWTIKILARDSLVLKKTLAVLRETIHVSAGWSQAGLRKL